VQQSLQSKLKCYVAGLNQPILAAVPPTVIISKMHRQPQDFSRGRQWGGLWRMEVLQRGSPGAEPPEVNILSKYCI